MEVIIFNDWMTKMIKLFRKKQETIPALIFAVGFSFFNIYGHALKTKEILDTADILIMSFNIMVSTLIVGELYIRIRDKINSCMLYESIEQRYDKKYFICVSFINFLSWMPVFLAYYPGLFTYDVATQIPQIIGNYSTHHPLVHTLYLQFFYTYVGGKILNNYTTGIAIATIVQMILFSLMISYVHLFLYRVNVKKILRYAFIIFTSIMPFMSVLSISMTKDIFFSGFMCIFFVCICSWNGMYPMNKKSQKIIYLISIIGIILFRNNGIYVMAIVAACSIVTMIRKKTYLCGILTIVGIIGALFISSCLETLLHADKGSSNEALSLPYQQIACVYYNEFDELTEQTKKEIQEILPNIEYYNPYKADGIKAYATGADNLPQLLRVYISLGTKYPQDYLKGGVQNNLGYLYLFDISNAEVYGSTKEGRQGFLLSDTKEGFEIIHTSCFTILETIYENLFTVNKYQDVLFLNLLCSPALYLWIIVLLLFYTVDLKKTKMVMPFAFLITFLLTIFAGPCALIRYALPYVLCAFPLFICIFENKNAINI